MNRCATRFIRCVTRREHDKGTGGQGDKGPSKCVLSPCPLVSLSPCPNRTIPPTMSQQRNPPMPWPQNRRLIGTKVPRLDGPEKSTGRARYTFDINRPGMLHAKVLRCPHAHAKVRSIDATAA